MINLPTRRTIATLGAAVLASSTLLTSAADATTIRTRGNGQYVDLSWTEYDPDDLLGLPGNVHIGYLYASYDQYGTYFYGSVSDFDCEEGETPWGGGGHGTVDEVEDALAEVVDEGQDAAADSAQDAIDDLIDAGGTTIDGAAVIEEIRTGLADEVSSTVEDEFEEYPACDYLQDRFLDGTGTATMTVDKQAQVARITGTLTVSSGGHGDPGDVIGRPTIDVTITGGEREVYEYSYSSRGETYRYSDWQKGTRYYGGTIEGGIGAMGFADDEDDASWGGFTHYRFETVERIR